MLGLTQGKPVERRGRKATGLRAQLPKTAGLPLHVRDVSVPVSRFSGLALSRQRHDGNSGEGPMTMICATQAPSSSVDPSDIEIIHLGPIRPGPFMLTLCPLDAQAAIRPPQSPELRRFTFLRAS